MVLVLFALAPVAVVVALLLGILFDVPRLGAAIALVLIASSAGALLAVVSLATRRYRRVRAVLDGESITLDTASKLVLNGDPLVSPFPRARRVSFGYRLPFTADAVATWGMATGSPFAREQLSGLATSWRLGWSDIVAVFSSTTNPVAISLALGRIDTSTLVLLARTVAGADAAGGAVANAIARYVGATAGADGLPLTLRSWLTERLVIAGDLDAAARLLGRAATTMNGQLVAIDVLNPFSPGALESDPDLWLAALNTLFRRSGLEGVTLTAVAGAPMDRLRGEPTEPVDGPLVSIVMAVHRPDEAVLRAAVQSVLDQSWTNWELLLVDDGSPAAGTRLLVHVAAQDPRIRLVQERANAGTYVRRNEAILAARGEFVTMHDADDWMHPRRIELQMRHLIARADLLANVCRSARVTSELRFVQPRGTVLRLTEASLLFRRAATLERIGFFDSVRKAADTGFRLRLEAATGRRVPIVDVEAPLVFARSDPSSLSGGDLRDGWTHPARIAYSSAHAAWLAAERPSGRAPRIEFPLVGRPFPAPALLRGEVDPRLELDLVFVLDVRDVPRRTREAHQDVDDVRAAVESGLRVGIRRLDALTAAGVAPSARRDVQDLISSGSVVELLPGRQVDAGTMVVLRDEVLLAAPESPDGMSAERLLVVSDWSPTLVLDRAQISAGAARLFPGAAPRYVTRAVARNAVAVRS